MEERVLGTFKKNGKEDVRVIVRTWNGYELLDIRGWYKDDKDEYRPSAKGISIRLEQVPELLKALKPLEKLFQGDEKSGPTSA